MKRNKQILIAAALAAILTVSGCAAKTGTASAASSKSDSAPTSSISSSTQKVFTLEELKKYDGKNGSAAYVAVNGVVYDITNAKNWNGGSHHGYTAGADLTQAIKQSPHGTSVLGGLPVVGKLQ